MEIKNHFGVYGVCLQEGKLLCIEKLEAPINIVLIYRVVVRNSVRVDRNPQERSSGRDGYTLSRYSNPRGL